MTNGAELLVDTLVRCGVDTVFGFPGDTSIALYESLGRRAGEIRHVLTRDERHAGFMADAYTRTTRRVGVCESSSGAGAVYLASGLAEAFASSIPVLAISTDNPRSSRGTAAISDVDQGQLFAACTKWRCRPTRAAEIPVLVEKGISVAAQGRPGPVALIVPEDVLEDAAPAHPRDGTRAVEAIVPTRRAAAPSEAVGRAAARLARAERPVAVVGGGAHLSGAGEEITRMAEHLAMPVATTIHGKGIMDERHPFALGVVGSNGVRDYTNTWVSSSDLVLFVGTRANATDTLGFTVPARGASDIVHIDADPERAGRNYPGSIGLTGDAKAVLATLRAHVPAAPYPVRAARCAELAAARKQWEREAERCSLTLDSGVLSAREVVQALRRAFGRDVWIVADAGTPTPHLACYWEAPGDGWRVVIPRGHGPMGFAIPASIGVAVAHPGQRIVCVTTESSVAMSVGEWETATRLRLPITYVVLDNGSLGWIKMLQHLYAGGRYFAVDPGRVDPVALGTGMGLPGARAQSLDHLTSLAEEAAEADGPSVIHVVVPEHIDAPPPVPAWNDALMGHSSRRPVH